MATKKSLQYYMNLDWSYTVEQDTANKKRFYIIRVNELPGVCTDAKTIEEGMREIKDALKATLQLYLKQGEPIPVPIKQEDFKGRIAYRTTPERHYRLAKIAGQEHKSISKTLDMLIDVGLNQIRPRS